MHVNGPLAKVGAGLLLLGLVYLGGAEMARSELSDASTALAVRKAQKEGGLNWATQPQTMTATANIERVRLKYYGDDDAEVQEQKDSAGDRRLYRQRTGTLLLAVGAILILGSIGMVRRSDT